MEKPRGLQTDGVMPGDLEVRRTMGPVSSGRGLGQETKVDDLQRALEGEMVSFLGQQNSKLIEELAYLRDKMQKGSAGKAESGMESSPWSAVGGASTQSSKDTMGVPQSVTSQSV